MVTLQLHNYEYDALLAALEEKKAQAATEEDYVLANSYKNRINQHRITKGLEAENPDQHSINWDDLRAEPVPTLEQLPRLEVGGTATGRFPPKAPSFSMDQHVNLIGAIITDRYQGRASTDTVLNLLLELGWTAPDFPNLPPNAN
jgi:hypothetical protein